MQRIIPLLAITFFAFIVWIIYLANTGKDSIFFDFVRSFPYGDKFGHVGLMGALTLLSTISLRFRALQLGRVNLYYGAILVFAFILAEEASQAFIPSRTFDFFDMAANVSGIVLGAWMCYWGKKYWEKSTSQETEVAKRMTVDEIRTKYSRTE